MSRTIKREFGFTQIEVIIAVVLLVAAVGSGMQVFVSGHQVQTHLVTRDVTGDRLRRTVDRLADVLRGASPLTMEGVPDLPDTSTEVRYRRLIRYDDATGAEWGPEEIVRWRLDAGEVQNGLDDDGDGRVDNGWLVREVDGTEERWCPGVVSLSFGRDGRALIVEIACESVDSVGRIVTERRRSRVLLEN